MNPQIEEVKDRSLWEEFIKGIPHTPFLQSFAWGEFQSEIGSKTYRFGFFDKNNLVGLSSVFQITSKFSSYLYVPWGPRLKTWSEDLLKEFLETLLSTANREKLDFIRLEPRNFSEEQAKALSNAGFRKTHSLTQPQCTSIIDLSKSEDELLLEMSDSTRYNVRMVERKGVKVRIGGSKDLDSFEKLLKETASRHGFSTDIHPGYYKKQYEILNRSKLMEIFVAELNNEPLATALVIFYGDTITYLHAASTRSQSKLRAPYLLAWGSILEGKKRGFKYFDFWGVAGENGSANHPWAGVTSFKMSFGGERVCYSPVFDLPTSNRYLLAKFIEVARKPVKKILRI